MSISKFTPSHAPMRAPPRLKAKKFRIAAALSPTPAIPTQLRSFFLKARARICLALSLRDASLEPRCKLGTFRRHMNTGRILVRSASKSSNPKGISKLHSQSKRGQCRPPGPGVVQLAPGLICLAQTARPFPEWPRGYPPDHSKNCPSVTGPGQG